jgi:hypothetical protein
MTREVCDHDTDPYGRRIALQLPAQSLTIPRGPPACQQRLVDLIHQAGRRIRQLRGSPPTGTLDSLYYSIVSGLFARRATPPPASTRDSDVAAVPLVQQLEPREGVQH